MIVVRRCVELKLFCKLIMFAYAQDCRRLRIVLWLRICQLNFEFASFFRTLSWIPQHGSDAAATMHRRHCTASRTPGLVPQRFQLNLVESTKIGSVREGTLNRQFCRLGYAQRIRFIIRSSFSIQIDRIELEIRVNSTGNENRRFGCGARGLDAGCFGRVEWDRSSGSGGFITASFDRFGTSLRRFDSRQFPRLARPVSNSHRQSHPSLAVQTLILRANKALEPYSPGMSGPEVDLVLSDMLQNLTGNPLKDAQGSLDLCTAALSFALGNLSIQKDTISTKPSFANGNNGARGRTRAEKKGPVLVMKSLTSDLSKGFEMELKRHFSTVKREKPKSSRPESREFYWVCGGLKDRSQVAEVDEQQEKDELAIYF